MITTTNPPEREPEPEPVPTPEPAIELVACPACYQPRHLGYCRGEMRPAAKSGSLTSAPQPNPVPPPESTRRSDRYIDDKFLEIFAHEDRNPALSRIVTEALAQNDNGGQWAPITSWRDWWARAKRAENQSQGGN